MLKKMEIRIQKGRGEKEREKNKEEKEEKKHLLSTHPTATAGESVP